MRNWTDSSRRADKWRVRSYSPRDTIQLGSGIAPRIVTAGEASRTEVPLISTVLGEAWNHAPLTCMRAGNVLAEVGGPGQLPAPPTARLISKYIGLSVPGKVSSL